jgi:TRAP-type mannitol/chloroaromatic compound transport system permease small subunit
MQSLDRIIHLLNRLSAGFGLLASWMMISLVVAVVIVVGLRYIFSIGFVWMQELYIWFHATAFLLGAGYTLLHDGHVRIDLFYRGARPRIKALINCLGTVFFAAPILWLIFDRSLPMVTRSWRVLENP